MSFSQNHIHRIFEQAAPHYDLMNDIMSGSFHRLWKAQFVNSLPRLQNATWVDVGAGTGDIAHRLYHAHHAYSPTIIACEPNQKMRAIGQRTSIQKGILNIQWCANDALNLPLEPQMANGMLFSFSLRNIEDWTQALSTAYQCTRMNGTIHIMEFNAQAHLENPLIHYYQNYLVPKLGRWFASQEPYDYLVNSIQSFASPHEITKQLASAGWKNITQHNIGAHAVTIIKGVKS